MSQPTCEERIDGNLRDRLDFFAGIVAATHEPLTAEDLEGRDDEELTELVEERHPDIPWTKGDDGHYHEAEDRGSLIEALVEQSEGADDAWLEAPISMSSRRLITIQFSWGGPSDEFEVTVDEDGDIDRIDYIFKDWWDGARRTLEGADFTTAADFLSRFVELEIGRY